MLNLRAYLGELVRALGVLALLLFALVPGAAPDTGLDYTQIGASAAVSASILKSGGDPSIGGWGDSQSRHAACHACTGAMPVLPVRSRGAAFPVGPVVPVRYAPTHDAVRLAPLAPRPPSQGPPVA